NYFLLKEGVSVSDVNQKLPETLKVYQDPFLQKAVGISYDEFVNGGNFFNYELTPITDIHLHSHLQSEIEANGSMDNIYIFSAIGLIILFLACFNFMNLSTAKSSKRAKEVGVRKILGSLKSSLINQFLTESVMISLFALVIAVILVNFSLSSFNHFTGKEISNPLFGPMSLWPYALLGSIVIGMLAGLYPAFVLSSFNPVKVLKGTLVSGSKGTLLRNSLVVFQFTISIIMIIGTAVVYKQLTFSRNKSLGYDQSRVLMLDNTYVIGEGIEAFKNELSNDPDVVSLTSSLFFPTRNLSNDNTFNRAEDNNIESAQNMHTWNIDDTYFPTLGMKIVSGRNFDRSFGQDSMGVILNQTAAKAFGYQDAIGKKIKFVDSDEKFPVIGVVEDFFFESFKEALKPMIFFHSKNNSTTAIRYRSENPRELLQRVEQIWEKHAGGHPFEYSFMDQEFDNRFKEDQKLGSILTFFSALAIFIACLGLFALASFTA
ncbi:MAG: FtsX-like permease family protein, partial [Bacteroidetes bacterium]|nr:FtsX-like permease family protein [Bacteroidota bacterium]